MIGILIVSHGDMATGLIASLDFLHERVKGVAALGLQLHQTVEDFDRKMNESISGVDEGDGVLILADITGGTPANRALLRAASRPDMEVLTGVSLPLLLEAVDARDRGDMAALCDRLMDAAPNCCIWASRLLRQGYPPADQLDELMK